MIKNQDGTFIYLVVPSKYNCVYEKLLVKLSDLGIDIVKDCGATCRGINRHVINCWNMFQSACAAYSLNEVKKADLLINYVNEQLKLNCPYYTDDPVAIEPPVIKDFSLNIKDVVGGQTVNINSASFTIDNIDSAKENSLKIINDKTNEVIVSGLGLTSPQTFTPVPFIVGEGNTYYFKAVIEDKNGKEYSSNVYTIKCGVKPVVNYNYYGTNENITTATIEQGNKTESNKISRLATPTKVVWFAIPKDKTITIDNADFAGDWFYNAGLGYNNNRLQTIETVTINNKEYSFYKFVYFVNIEINLNVTIQ